MLLLVAHYYFIILIISKSKKNPVLSEEIIVHNQDLNWCCIYTHLLITNDIFIISKNCNQRKEKLQYFLFRNNRNRNKEDKDTITDYVEWNNEVVCSCSDVDASTGKCSLCNPIYDVFDTSKKNMNSIGVQKGKDKPKKKRFSFLHKNFQDKKKTKDLENRDRKCVYRTNIGMIELRNGQDSKYFIFTVA